MIKGETMVMKKHRIMWLLLWAIAMMALAIPVALWIPNHLITWWLGGFTGALMWLWGGERYLR